MGDEDVHMAIVLAYYGVLYERTEIGQKCGVMVAFAEASSIIRQYKTYYLCHGYLLMALEYHLQAAAAVGGRQLLWSGRRNMDEQRKKSSMLKELVTELLSRDGGIDILLGPRGTGEGQLGRFFTDEKTRQQFLLEAARQYQDAGFHDKSIEIQKSGGISAALDTINKCLSGAICALAHGRLDSKSRTSGLILSGNEILEMFKYYPEIRELKCVGATNCSKTAGGCAIHS